MLPHPRLAPPIHSRETKQQGRLAVITHLVKGLDPVANAFAGTRYSAVVNLKYYGTADFIVYQGVGATGTGRVTIEACKDVAASEVADTSFAYLRVSPGDNHSTPVQALALTTAPGASQVHVFRIAAGMLPPGWTYARLKWVEQVVGPIEGA